MKKSVQKKLLLLSFVIIVSAGALFVAVNAETVSSSIVIPTNCGPGQANPTAAAGCMAAVDIYNPVITCPPEAPNVYYSHSWNGNQGALMCAPANATEITDGAQCKHTNGLIYYSENLCAFARTSKDGSGTSLYDTWLKCKKGSTLQGQTCFTDISPSPSSNPGWTSHTWTFSDGSMPTQISTRTDQAYLDFIAALEVQCKTITKSQMKMKMNSYGFMGPDCGGGSTSPSPSPSPSPEPSPSPSPVSPPSTDTYYRTYDGKELVECDIETYDKTKTGVDCTKMSKKTESFFKFVLVDQYKKAQEKVKRYKTINVESGTLAVCDPATFDASKSSFPCIYMTQAQEVQYAKTALELSLKLKEKNTVAPPTNTTTIIYQETPRTEETCKAQLSLLKSNVTGEKNKVISYSTTISRRYADDRELLDATKNKVIQAQKKIDEVLTAVKTGSCQSDMTELQQKVSDVESIAGDLSNTRTTYNCRVLTNRERVLLYDLGEMKNLPPESSAKLQSQIQSISNSRTAACTAKDEFAIATARIDLAQAEQDLKNLSQQISKGTTDKNIQQKTSSLSASGTNEIILNYREFAEISVQRATELTTCKALKKSSKQLNTTVTQLEKNAKKNDQKRTQKLLVKAKKQQSLVTKEMAKCSAR